MKHQQISVCSVKNSVLSLFSFTLMLLTFFCACTKTVSTTPASPATPPPTPPPPVVQNPPSNIDFTVDGVGYNFEFDPNDLTTSVKIDAKAENATSYKWDFGDATTATTQANTVTHKYKKSGNYIVSLIAMNGTKAAPTVKKSIGTINVFNGGIELTSTDQNGTPEYPWVTDVSTIPQPGALRMYFYLLRENGVDGGNLLFQGTYSCTSNLPTETSGLYRSVFSLNNLVGTLEMSPYNKAFRFNLITMKVERDLTESVDHITADYRNVTAKTIWEQCLTPTQKDDLVSGKVVSNVRILETRTQINDNAKLYFNARLIKI